MYVQQHRSGHSHRLLHSVLKKEAKMRFVKVYTKQLLLTKTREMKTNSKILIMLIKKKRVIMFEVMGDSAVLVYEN